jgi:hypothetical protein
MDDEEEFIQLNLSSRPKREEKRKQRERERLEREISEREAADRSLRSSSDGAGGAGARGGGGFAAAAGGGPGGDGGAARRKPNGRTERIAQLRQRVGDDTGGGSKSEEDGTGSYQDAQDALEEMVEEVGGWICRRRLCLCCAGA